MSQARRMRMGLLDLGAMVAMRISQLPSALAGRMVAGMARTHSARAAAKTKNTRDFFMLYPEKEVAQVLLGLLTLAEAGMFRDGEGERPLQSSLDSLEECLGLPRIELTGLPAHAEPSPVGELRNDV